MCETAKSDSISNGSDYLTYILSAAGAPHSDPHSDPQSDPLPHPHLYSHTYPHTDHHSDDRSTLKSKIRNILRSVPRSTEAATNHGRVFRWCRSRGRTILELWIKIKYL